MHPLDLVKTRFQIQANPIAGQESQHYTGVYDCMKKMYKSEGLFSFWKGIIPPIFAETPKRAWKVNGWNLSIFYLLKIENSSNHFHRDIFFTFQFFTFEQFQKVFNFGGPDGKPTPLVSKLKY